MNIAIFARFTSQMSIKRVSTASYDPKEDPKRKYSKFIKESSSFRIVLDAD